MKTVRSLFLTAAATVVLAGQAGLAAPAIRSLLETVDVATGARTLVKAFDGRIEAPNWTRDGRWLVYNAKGRLWRIAPEGGEPELVDTGDCTQCNNDHVLSFDGKSVAVSDDSRKRGSWIFTMPLFGEGPVVPRPVVARGGSYLHGWSPDGKTLVYCAMRPSDPKGDVYSVSVDGGEEVRLTSAPGLDDGPEFSPCGKYIWFNSSRSGLMQAWRMKADGTEQVQMTHDDANCWFPHVSPDGKMVVYLAYNRNDLKPDEHLADLNVELRLMPSEGGPSRPLLKLFGGQGTINVNSWSPDSRKIAFVSYRQVPSPVAEVVTTVHPQRDVVIAERVLMPTDAAHLQSAIDDVARLGGGTVFLAKGTYTIDAPITVKRGVTVRGDYDADHPADSTVLSIVCGAGEEEGPAAFSMEHGSGLVGLVFFHPNQSLDRPTPYPWTVRSHLRHAGNNQTIDDCTFVNSWRAIAIGPETNECHTFRRVKICALRTGFFIDMTTDIGRVYETTVSPSVWTESAFPGAPDKATLAAYLKAHGAVAADYARSDWEFVRGLSVDGYHVGAQFHLGKSPVGMNGVMAACRITDCDLAIAAEAMNEVGLAVYDSDFARNATNLVCSSAFDSVVMFHSCRFADGPLVLGPKGTLNLRACAVGGTVDATAGGRLMRDDAPAAGVVKYEPMAFARPQGGKVVFAEVDPKAEDCTAAIQAALDGVAAGTVYLPAGVYRCRGTLTVPSGVELRGASAVPHHTMSGGTVLFVTGGRGEAGGTPFVSLRPGAGLRGLSFWYPEQDVGAPVAYPWTVRSLGPGCWMTDVNIANSWQGADFATHPSDGHRISYFSGGFYRTGLAVGKSATTGWVEDVQMNTHYVYRRPGNHPLKEPKGPQKGEPPFMLYQRDWLRGLVFADCADERISGTFLYAARDGIVFNGKVKAFVLIHGTDTGCRAFTVKTEKGSSVTGALVQLVAIGRQVESSIAVQEGNAGDLTLFATQFWPRFPLLDQYGTGRTTLDQFNGVAGPVRVHSGAADIIGGLFRRHLKTFVESDPPAAVTSRGCALESR